MSRLNLFRAESKAMHVMRWMIEHGERTSVQMKAEFHRLGAVQNNIMHTFDRYVRATYKSLRSADSNARRPVDGLDVNTEMSSLVLVRVREGHRYRIVWVGSAGATFEERAMNFFAMLDDAELDHAHAFLERELLACDNLPSAVNVNVETTDAEFAVFTNAHRALERAQRWMSFVVAETQRRMHAQRMAA